MYQISVFTYSFYLIRRINQSCDLISYNIIAFICDLNICVFIQWIAVSVAYSYPVSRFSIVVGINSVICLRLRINIRAFLLRSGADEQIRINLEMLGQNLVNKLIVLIAIFSLQFCCRRYRPTSRCHILKLWKYLCITECCFFKASHSSSMICQIVIDNKFIQRSSIIRYLWQICNCIECLSYMRILCDYKLCVRIVYLCTSSIQISTNCALWLNYGYLRWRSSHINAVIRSFNTRYIVFLIISFGRNKFHALHILLAEVEIIGIVFDFRIIYRLSFLFNVNNISIFIINLISVIIYLRNKTSSSCIIVSALVTFSKNTIICNSVLTVSVAEGNIYFWIIVFPISLLWSVRNYFKVINSCLDFESKLTIKWTCRMCTCNISSVIITVKIRWRRSRNFKYNCFVTSLFVRVRPL